MIVEVVITAVIALIAGLLIGWLVAGRETGRTRADLSAAQARLADYETRRALAEIVERERGEFLTELTALRAQSAEREAAFTMRWAEREAAHAQAQDRLLADKEALAAQFAELGARLLDEAQTKFLQRADERFRQSEETAGQGLKALLQPVHERLQKYEESVQKTEAERHNAFGLLHGQIEAMRSGTERVSSEAAKLVNALRNAPKARGRWGEQQLRNVLESCGLSEHADFATEVNVTGSDGARLRPDVIVNIPGGQSLVIDAKVSLNAYQDAFGAVDEDERRRHLDLHAASMRNHVNALGNKAYWSQFADAPDYVVMFVPGEHFLSAALEHAPDLWDYAFERRVLLATPTNLIAIARTVSAVWRQEKLAGQAREIAELGKELYARLATMGSHVGRVGRNLDTAVSAYNAFVGSLETQVLTQAKRFEALNIDTGGKSIESLPNIDQSARPLVKLVATAAPEPAAALSLSKNG
ncbi:MAG: DNA recombination protein RmuC [Sphingomonadaceae bacterium]